MNCKSSHIRPLYLIMMLLMGCFSTITMAQNPLGINTGETQKPLQPVHWEAAAEVKGNQVVLVMTATIDTGWHLYAQTLESDDGPLPTVFTFNLPEQAKCAGEVKALSEVHESYDANFLMNLRYFEEEAVFHQTINIEKPGTYTLKASVEFMTCDDERCLPPVLVEFELPVTIEAKTKDTQNTAPASVPTERSTPNYE